MKVFVLYNKCWSYRQPVFEDLGRRFELKVGYSLGSAPAQSKNYTTVELPISKYGRFVFHRDNLRDLVKGYDVIIAYGDIAWISLMKLSFGKRDYKLIYWTIGVRASYKSDYNSKSIWDKLRFYLYNRADALMIYSSVPLERYKNMGWDMKKIFVANNTVYVDNKNLQKVDKSRLLFVGTLYEAKGISELLEAYKRLNNDGVNLIPLDIVGGGDGLPAVKEFINNNSLQEVIVTHGPIYEEEKLKNMFSHSVACISPQQAGLSVLKSMGYGVPFVTNRKSKTGGEIFNIENNVTGILYDTNQELLDVIEEMSKDKSRFIELGDNAIDYYNTNRTVKDMADGIADAINFCKTQ